MLTSTKHGETVDGAADDVVPRATFHSEPAESTTTPKEPGKSSSTRGGGGSSSGDGSGGGAPVGDMGDASPTDGIFDGAGAKRWQGSFSRASADQKLALARQLRGRVVEAVLNSHGRNVVQHILTTLDLQDVDFVLDEIVAQVRRISEHKIGCRSMQDILSSSIIPEAAKARVAQGLRGHVRVAVEHPHANFVMQHMVDSMTPPNLSFMLEEMAGNARVIAEHKIGCRIMQRLLEHFPPNLIEPLFQEILRDWAVVEGLCRHQFGTHVMAHICTFGTPEQRGIVVQVIQQNPVGIATDVAGSNVVKKALKLPGSHVDPLALTLLCDEGTFQELACSAHGNFVARVLVSLPPGQARNKARDYVGRLQGVLQNNRSGREVIGEFQQGEGARPERSASRRARGRRTRQPQRGGGAGR
jgi:hypothetical protein